MKGTLYTLEGRFVLRFERRLWHAPEKVWRAITEPEQLAWWFPTDIEGERRLGGKIRFVFRNAEGPTLDGQITEFDPPRVFAYTWGDSVLRWELQPDGEGCLLVFTHTFGQDEEAAKFAAGWHVCLEALGSLLDGEPVSRSDDHWVALYQSYAKSLA